MNTFLYEDDGVIVEVTLPIGEKSQVSKVETELVSANFEPSVYEEMAFVADICGNEEAAFFSTRGAYKIKRGKFYYVEVKGCGVPNRGIIQEYFLADGRDKDEIIDPIGGFSLTKAIFEWEMLNKFRGAGIQTHTPIALLKLKDIKGPKGEDLALLVRSGISNIRLSYIKGLNLNNLDSLVEKVIYSVGKNLSAIHNRLNLCHNALYEENITLNGEIVDLEYVSPSTLDGIYQDIWYGLLSFAEIFGTPLNVSGFVEGYSGKKRTATIIGNEKDELEECSKSIASLMLDI